jgi:hypothetical protein
MQRIARRLTFANVMSVAAVFIALGGGAYAVSVAKNSVGSKSIKDGSIRGVDVKADSLTGSNINEATLSLPVAGPGAPGATGPQGPTGADGVTGVTGPGGVTGPAGATGRQGVAGEAVAYARVDSQGVLIGGAAQNKGVVQANVQHDATGDTATTGPGVYCFGNLGFTPTSAMVTIDNADQLPVPTISTGGTLNFIGSVAIQKGEGLGRCDADHQQARVAIEAVNDTATPTLANHPFFVWFEQ